MPRSFLLSPVLLFVRSVLILSVATLIMGCTPVASMPVTPPTVGPLNNVTLDQFGVSLLVPSNWKPPVAIDRNSFILTPDGSTDTSMTAGPFLYVVVDALTVFRAKTTFLDNFSDPAQQLDALNNAINRDSPQYDPIIPYKGAKYPAAILRSYDRDNEATIVLMNTGTSKGWIYVAAQFRRATFKAYEDAVFTPITNSITVLAP